MSPGSWGTTGEERGVNGYVAPSLLVPVDDLVAIGDPDHSIELAVVVEHVA